MRIFRLVCAALLTVGVVLGYVVSAPDPAVGFVRRTVVFLSFFTIVTNCLLVAVLAVPELAPRAAAGAILARPSVRGGVVVYAVMVGLIYVLLLKHLWSPTGWQAAADAIMHYAAPIIAVVDWVVFVPRGQTRWRHALWWVALPLAYAVYTLAHGAATGFYPYPFVDAAALGLDTVVGHMALILLGFLVLGLSVVLIDRVEGRSASRAAGRWR